MEIAALVSPLAGFALLAVAFRTTLARETVPVLFFVAVGGAILSLHATAHGQPVSGVTAGAGVLIACAGLGMLVLRIDAGLAATEAGGPARVLAGLPRSASSRWRRFEREFRAHVSALERAPGAAPPDAKRDADPGPDASP
jgi:hypothetical protein